MRLEPWVPTYLQCSARFVSESGGHVEKLVLLGIKNGQGEPLLHASRIGFLSAAGGVECNGSFVPAFILHNEPHTQEEGFDVNNLGEKALVLARVVERAVVGLVEVEVKLVLVRKRREGREHGIVAKVSVLVCLWGLLGVGMVCLLIPVKRGHWRKAAEVQQLLLKDSRSVRERGGKPV